MIRSLVAAIAATFLGAAAMLVAPLAGANANAPAEAAVKRLIEERIPGVKVQGVMKTPYGGLFEIRTDDNELIYADEKVTFIIDGNLLDGKDPRKNYTRDRMRQLTGFKFEELPFKNAIRIVRGNGKRQLAYFSDPNCPYCRKLEEELAQVNDVTVHMFLMPILSAESMPKSKAVWCSPDRAKAWFDLMFKNIMPTASGTCDNPIEQVLAFGRKHKVESVPTLVFANGERVSGMRPAAQISQMLDAAAKK